MTMKKRFLGLALAAMVAVPTTGVYAASGTTSVSGSANDEITHKVDVQGVIKGNDGTVPAGRIEVIVPTAMEFTVDKDGNFIAANNYNVENKSSDVNIKVQVAEFTETNPSSGIEVKESVQSSDKRSSVKLSLIGNQAGSGVALKHNGITTPQDLLTVEAGGIAGIVLDGEAGKTALEQANENGVTEKFNVTFKIVKQQ